MRSLFYLLLMSAKNTILELRRKPAMLILYLLIIGMIVFSVVVNLRQQADWTNHLGYAPAYFLTAIFFGFMMFFVIQALQKGISSGDTFFDMNDVNLLFVSPVNPKKILLYGVARMVKIAFISSFFILFQSTSLGRAFGVSFADLCMILLIYILAFLLSEIVALLIYSTTAGRPRRQLFVKLGAGLCLLPAAALFTYQYMQSQSAAAALEHTLSSPFFRAIPIAGWASQAVNEWVMENWLAAAAYIGLIILTGASLTAMIMNSKSDYYEDVLCATETAFEKKRALAEGNINAQSLSSRKVRVTGTGLFGYGVKALFGRQLRESMRENRFVLLPTQTVITIIITCVVSFFWEKSANFVLYALMMLMWIQVFMVGTGRGLRDTYVHYIYMIPASSFAKIVWSNLQQVFQIMIESIVMFSIIGAVKGCSIQLIIACIVTFTLFSLFLLGINYLSMRWTAANLSAGFLIMIYMIAVLVLVLPGLIPAVIAGFSIGGASGILIGLAIFSGWELAGALICFALSKGVLDRCDMPVMPLKK